MDKYDSVTFDKEHIYFADNVKKRVQDLDYIIENFINNSRSKSICLTKLEEFHLWLGKALKENQCYINKEI